MNITGVLGSRLSQVDSGITDTFWIDGPGIFLVSQFTANTGAIPKIVDGGGKGQKIEFNASKNWTGVKILVYFL